MCQASELLTTEMKGNDLEHRHHHYPTPSIRFDYSCLLTLDIVSLQTAPRLLQCDPSLPRIRSSASTLLARSRAAADCLVLLAGQHLGQRCELEQINDLVTVGRPQSPGGNQTGHSEKPDGDVEKSLGEWHADDVSQGGGACTEIILFLPS